MTVTKIDNDYDPYAHRKLEKPITNFETFICLIKSAIGIGCLAMPKAFEQAGWLNGAISTFVIGVIIVFSLHVLLRGMYELCRQQRVPTLTYPQSLALAFAEGPPALKFFSGIAHMTVDIYMALYHFGVCCVYIIFIADNLKEVGLEYKIDIDNRLYIIALTIPLIMVYLVRKLKHLVPFNAVANLLLFLGVVIWTFIDISAGLLTQVSFTGFGILFYYIFSDLPALSERHTFGIWRNYPLFFGTVLFSVESVGVIISVEANMKTPRDYLGWTGILNLGLGASTLLYVMLAFFGYWRYGDSVKDSVTFNMPQTELLPRVAKLTFAGAVFFSYALQGHITIDVMWRRYLEALGEMDNCTCALEYVMRVALVLASVLVAIVNSQLALILSLVGSLCLTHLGFTFPGLLDLCIKYNVGYGPFKIYLLQDVFLICFGIVGGVMGSWVAIYDLREHYKQVN